MNTSYGLVITGESVNLMKLAGYYGWGFSLGLLYLIPACIAIRMRPTLPVVIWPIETLADAVSYVLGGSMYYGAIYSVLHANAFPTTAPTVEFLLLPYWPAFILKPMLWVQKIVSLMSRLSFNKPAKPVPLYSKTKNAKKKKVNGEGSAPDGAPD